MKLAIGVLSDKIRAIKQLDFNPDGSSPTQGGPRANAHPKRNLAQSQSVDQATRGGPVGGGRVPTTRRIPGDPPSGTGQRESQDGAEVAPSLRIRDR